jgi:hypothetical protein
MDGSGASSVSNTKRIILCVLSASDKANIDSDVPQTTSYQFAQVVHYGIIVISRTYARHMMMRKGIKKAVEIYLHLWVIMVIISLLNVDRTKSHNHT